MEINELPLSNLGVFISKIPHNLFTKLKVECLNFNVKEKRTTGLTSNKIPTHYNLKDNNEELFTYLRFFVMEYDKKYNFFNTYKKNYFKKNIKIVFGKPWFNIQRKNEFIPNHIHEGILSYTIWIQIPNLKKNENNKYDSNIEINYQNILGGTTSHMISLNKNFEGSFLLFPSNLTHCVYPFFDSDEIRISISGNISINT